MTPMRRLISSSVYDPQTGFKLGTGDSRADWDERARTNPRYFIAVDYAATEEEFRASGERHLHNIVLKGLELNPDTIALEIGCGMGRLLRPLAARVKEAHGVDISPEMVKKGNEDLKDVPNAKCHVTTGDLSMFESGSMDFCYSSRVFQHIPTREAVLAYLKEASRVLKPGGTFRFLSEHPGRRATEGGTWFGVLFREQELRSLLAGMGFEVQSLERENSPEKQELWDYAVVTCLRTPR